MFTLLVHPSAPQNLRADFNATSADVSWSPPQYPNGTVQYRLTCTRNDDDEPRTSYLYGASMSIEDLHPHTDYNCCVTARNNVGEGRNICTSFMTSEAGRLCPVGIHTFKPINIYDIEFVRFLIPRIALSLSIHAQNLY